MQGVIKNESQIHSEQRATSFELGDFVIEGQQIVAAARAKAKEILDQAKNVADMGTETACRKGMEEGYRKGLEEGRTAGRAEALEKAKEEFEARHVQLASACESLFREVDRRKKDLMLSAHRDLIVLAVKIAERVTKRIGRVDPETVTDNFKAVVDLVGQVSDMVVEVNPADAETLEQFAPDLVARRSDLKHVTVKISDQVDPGGCAIQTRDGRIDATLQTQLERVARELVPGLDLGPADRADADEGDQEQAS